MDLSILASEVDLEPTLERVCDDKALLIELLTMLVDDFKQGQRELLEHLDAEDYEWLRRKGHHHKGIGANLGLVKFTAAAKSMETCAQATDKAQCAAAYHEMLEATRRVEALLRALPRS
jgi:HPt (histidine-containing phosphotransfer) domain-containing protein